MTGLSVTNGTDQLFVIHIDGADDIVGCVHQTNPDQDDRVPEAVGRLISIMKR